MVKWYVVTNKAEQVEFSSAYEMFEDMAKSKFTGKVMQIIRNGVNEVNLWTFENGRVVKRTAAVYPNAFLIHLLIQADKEEVIAIIEKSLTGKHRRREEDMIEFVERIAEETSFNEYTYETCEKLLKEIVTLEIEPILWKIDMFFEYLPKHVAITGKIPTMSKVKGLFANQFQQV